MQMRRSGSPFCRGLKNQQMELLHHTHERKLGAIDSVTPQTPISITRVRVFGGPPIFSRDPTGFLPLLTRSNVVHTSRFSSLLLAMPTTFLPSLSPSPGLENAHVSSSSPPPRPTTPRLENAHTSSSSPSSRPRPCPPPPSVGLVTVSTNVHFQSSFFLRQNFFVLFFFFPIVLGNFQSQTKGKKQEKSGKKGDHSFVFVDYFAPPTCQTYFHFLLLLKYLFRLGIN